MVRSNIYLLALTGFILLMVAGCAISENDETGATGTDEEAKEHTYDQSKVFGEAGETKSELPGQIAIEGLGLFDFNPEDIKTLRDDIFLEGHFSIFDVLVHLGQRGDIELDYSFDPEMNTHVINSLDGEKLWWYSAFYDGGWTEVSVFRMDHYPYKDGMSIYFYQEEHSFIALVYRSYREEIERRLENDGSIIVPAVTIEGKDETLVFESIAVEANNLRSDMFQPDVITAIDVIITLGNMGEITYDLQWYESIGSADVVKSYWVNRINEDESFRRCGFVYEAGAREFSLFRGNHIHIPSDIRVINSPQYVKYFWICL